MEHFAMPYGFSSIRCAFYYSTALVPEVVERLAAGEVFMEPTNDPDEYQLVRKQQQRIHMEAEIECFENWQENETEESVIRRRAENGSIAYAMVESGGILPPHTTGRDLWGCGWGKGVLSHPFRPDAPAPRASPTGRFPSQPAIQEWPVRHPYPSDGILRD